jgi:hypothetical protein
MENVKLKLLILIAIVTTVSPVFTVKIFAQSQYDAFSKEVFKNPTTSSKPLTWWHWINGNITKDGIKKDLADMKRIGIGGVQLFDTHMYLPKGPIRYGSDAWFDHVHYAMQMCDSLGLEFYITNSPGWSGAGGPWITLEKSMKQLVYSETNAGNSKSTPLAVPFTKNGFYKDVAVIAVSAARDEEKELKAALVKVSCMATNHELNNLTDNDNQTSIPFEKGKSDSMPILFEFKSAVDINSLNINLSAIQKKIDFKGTVDISADGKNYHQANVYNFVNHEATTGNFSIPFIAEKIKFLRLTIDNPKSSFNIDEIKLKNLYGLKDWTSRTGMSKSTFLNTEILTKDERQALYKKEVIDITRFFDAETGLLKWAAPAGNWTILRFGFTTTGKIIHPAVDEGTGYEVDKLDPAAVTYQFNQSLGRIIKDAGNLTGKTFKGILFDSFEGGFQNWTATLPQLFAARNNYEIIPYLPILTGRIIESKAKTSAVLWDYQKTLTTLFAENYYGTMQKLANQYKLQTFSESQGGPMSPAHANAYVDVPMNEFWTDGIQFREKLIKQTVSIANILGKNIVGAEAFTSKPEFGKWQSTPESMKTIGDYAFTTGINRFIFHTYTHQPYDVVPGFTMGRYGTDFGRTNTWWKYGTAWMDYIGRSQYLLQQGHIVSDVCFLSTNDATYEYPAKVPSLPKGYNFDIIYPAYLNKIEVKNAELKLQTGPAYKLMILPDYPFMEMETLMAIQKLLKAGAIISGAPPVASPTVTDKAKSQQFTKLVKEIWGDLDGKSVVVKSYGKGKLYWGKRTEAIFAELSLEPDVKITAESTDSIRYIHKKFKNADIYFVSNQLDSDFNFRASFRNRNKQPEIWDAETGKTWNAVVFDTTGNTVSIPLNLTSGEALFVVFDQPLPPKWINDVAGKNTGFAAKLNSNHQLNLTRAPSEIEINFSDGTRQTKPLAKNRAEQVLNGTWTLNFLDGRGAPSNFKMKELKLWQTVEDPTIKYYSGTVSYQSQFDISEIEPAETMVLELGEVYDLAEVSVNGKVAGIIWKKPYQLNITSLLKKGNNNIEILVANRWINRLIGDEFIKTDLKYEISNNKFTTGKLLELPLWLGSATIMRTDGRYTFTTWKHYSSADPLVNSGLLGPVKITFHNNYR